MVPLLVEVIVPGVEIHPPTVVMGVDHAGEQCEHGPPDLASQHQMKHMLQGLIEDDQANPS